ncbi:MAG: ATP-binding cassette domain-containing protein [Clostridia bacterium]|nr:ATP-binding cassette domain-containing protein [Clostridia bacterium]
MRFDKHYARHGGKNTVTTRIETKLNISVEAATMMRVMSLPADFFKEYSSGELANRTSQVGTLCKMLVSTVMSTGLTSLFSLIYISQIFVYAPALVVPALLIILTSVVFSVVSSLVQMKHSAQIMELDGKESGMTYSLITGMQKIRLAGAEKRAFARRGNLYAKNADLEYGPPMLIELNNVSFGYSENIPLVIDDLSLKIRPGQYVAIVGKTSCGKSTLMRLLLGFEHPKKGAIYYDGKDLEKIELRSLRRRVGVVMQNGKLFQGDIYSNIVISAPWLTREAAWEAAKLAGIAEDIRSMPMGMDTMISEGAGGVSGGQRQRLMIARAIAPKPKILMFDEATSALDNITQKKISESLDSLKCTRIVIAHRLSTIKQCDRIIVLDRGKIVEDGKYAELIEKNGFFAELVARQRLDGAGQ